MQKKFGNAILDEYIKDYLNTSNNHAGWDKIQFKHLVNMSSAIGELGPTQSDHVLSDEANEKYGPWTWAYTKSEKLDITFSFDHYPWEPGEVLRYRTIMFNDVFAYNSPGHAQVANAIKPICN